MLWQSSLLIIVVFALDCALARKIRPAVRHALWMVVLVKLLLPPALALPTGATWWLWPARPPLTPVIKNQVVTFDTAPLPDFTSQTIPLAPPPVHLNGTGWMALAAGAVSAALLAWLVANWLKVARKTRRATASGAFDDTRNEAQHLAGLRGSLRLRLVDDTLSPAVYGLFRPVILLPRALTEKLSAAQLRAVLLHEAIHVRRGDVWVNCAQTLLQIAYWWHPLLWLANARIRRLREEAVDDAVMLALRADAATYAPTLLEVAKFAFRRPLASLGLVGILESRSKLRQRIERLVHFRPPRQAGVTALSLCGILAFSAVALPMGQAPAVVTDDSAPADNPLPVASASPSRMDITIQGNFFWMPSRDIETLTAGLPYDPGQIGEAPDWRADAEEFKEINQRIKSLQARPFSRNRIETGSGTGAEIYHGTRTNWITFDCDPVVSDGRIELDEKADACSVSPLGETNTIKLNGHATLQNNGGMILSTQGLDDSSSNLVLVINAKILQQQPAAADPPGTGGATNKFEIRMFKVGTNRPGREAIYGRLNRIRLDEVSYQNLPLSEVIRNLREQSLLRDPDKTGINFLFNPNVESTSSTASRPADPAGINITLKLKNVSLLDLLNAVCLVADHPVNYTVHDYGVVFEETNNSPQLEMRTFKVDPNILGSHLREILAADANLPRDLDALVKEYFLGQGINLDPPKNVFFNDRLGLLFVYATPQDLNVIERAIETMNVKTVPATERAIEATNVAGFTFASDPADFLDTRQQANDWARAGKISYEADDMDNAKRDLEKALSLEPDNQRARYYLNLISQAKAAPQSGQGSAFNFPASFVINPTNVLDPQQNAENYYSKQWAGDSLLRGKEYYEPAPPKYVSAPVNPADLETKQFQIGVAAFRANVRIETRETNPLLGFKELVANAGVDLSEPKHAALISERFGVLQVSATKKDLAVIQGVIDDLHCPPPQIHIKARFIEVPKRFFNDAHNSLPADLTNGGVLTNPQFQVFLHSVMQLKGVEELAEPEVVTLSGRQAQVRTTETALVITNYLFDAGSPNYPASKVLAQMDRAEVGPILDVMPDALSDGYTIDLTTIPYLIKFFGYADPRGLPPHYGTNSDGQKIEIPIVLPAFGIAEEWAEKKLYDGQTLVLLPRPEFEYRGNADEESRERIEQHIREAEKKEEDKVLIVLVTATLIDSVGNRVHSADEMPFAQAGFPLPWP